MALIVLLLGGDPGTDVGSKRWMVLCEDIWGEFWVDTTSGEVTSVPARLRKIEENKKQQAKGQIPPLVPIPVPVRNPDRGEVSTVRDLTVRTLRGRAGRRLSLERTGKRPIYLTKDRYDCFAPALSPDGRRVAYKRWDTKSLPRKPRKLDLVVHTIATGRDRVLVKRGLPSQHLWSPDGKWLSVTSGAFVAIYDAVRGSRKKSWNTSHFDPRFTNHRARTLVWSPKSTHLAARCMYIMKRENPGARVANRSYGEDKLVVIEVATGAAKIHKCPWGYWPLRGELRAPAPKK